jgi:hypothetical protein
MNKIWLVFMTGPGKEQDLRELCEPILPYIHGIVAVFHTPSDAGATYLESVKGAGEIIYTKFCRRHSFSRNHYLWSGPIKEGDWCLQLDDLERTPSSFVSRVSDLIQQFEGNGINTAFYFNKPFIYQYHDSLEFVGSPHEGLHRHDGQMRAVELSNYYPTETEIRYSIRHLKRPDPYHWVGHYAKYMLYPQSNHGLLGLADRGDPSVLYPIRERNRQVFLSEMRARGHPTTVDGLNALFAEPLDDKLRLLINLDKVWQDYYRYYVLGDLEVKDEHLWTSLKSV